MWLSYAETRTKKAEKRRDDARLPSKQEEEKRRIIVSLVSRTKQWDLDGMGSTPWVGETWGESERGRAKNACVSIDSWDIRRTHANSKWKSGFSSGESLHRRRRLNSTPFASPCDSLSFSLSHQTNSHLSSKIHFPRFSIYILCRHTVGYTGQSNNAYSNMHAVAVNLHLLRGLPCPLHAPNFYYLAHYEILCLGTIYNHEIRLLRLLQQAVLRTVTSSWALI